jgi:hypothetical protein
MMNKMMAMQMEMSRRMTGGGNQLPGMEQF